VNSKRSIALPSKYAQRFFPKKRFAQFSEVHLFEKLCFFRFPLQAIFKKFFQLLSGAMQIFQKDERSNKIESSQYFKNILVTGFQGQKHMKHIKFLEINISEPVLRVP
jgi:hypothetical protein